METGKHDEGGKDFPGLLLVTAVDAESAQGLVAASLLRFVYLAFTEPVSQSSSEVVTPAKQHSLQRSMSQLLKLCSQAPEVASGQRLLLRSLDPKPTEPILLSL